MLKRLEIAGFKSFVRKTVLDYSSSVTAIVGPNGSGKSNVAEAFRFALGEQSMKSMRGKRSEDLIWSGSNSIPRANRASVAITFDNRKRIFPKYDFEEITIERVVYRDGQSEYSMNGSKVRLRDIQELLSAANIGNTGHHIISQGEADRILIAAPRERRAMLEDALGLKIYEYKKLEAERKLEKTEENVKQVEALRRELAPHLKFLGKQVEKLERAEELKDTLSEAFQEYVSIEELYIETERENVRGERQASSETLSAATKELESFDEEKNGSKGLKHIEDVRKAERELDKVTAERSELSRSIGRVEGALSEAKKRSAAIARDPYVKVPREDFETLRDEVEKQGSLEKEADASALHAALSSLKSAVIAFFERFGLPNDDYLAEEEQAVYKLENEKKALLEKDSVLEERESKVRSDLNRAREARAAYEETGREQQHRILVLAETRAKEEGAVAKADARIRELDYLEEELSRDRAEVLALCGTSALSYQKRTSLPDEDRKTQEERKRSLERMKIRVEEAGGSGEDVRTEYKEAKEREEFLERELADLAKSAEGLRGLIDELDEELTKSFTDGLAKVNQSFSEFFSLMFGGGGARLVLEEVGKADEEEDDMEEFALIAPDEPKNKKPEKPGIEIQVNLPKKRLQSLMQLSGGERALTSIALIFAMSQVNPPPFLILDETDAALDEANSRRYGDMIESLAKKSQLIVITHNRETMSRAGILYGVTMGNDGVSKLLSVKFEEAVAVAK
jgi:chromosome segregation protein